MRVTVTTDSPDQTARLAQRIGAHVAPGDCLLLFGPVGAGKTHFARHLILSQLTTPEDVPSPTFTLVQTYDTRAGELWHADLYRLNTLDEVAELGLIDAFEQAICLIEWPELLDPVKPDSVLSLRFLPDTNNPDTPDTRQVQLEAEHGRWAGLLPGIAHE